MSCGIYKITNPSGKMYIGRSVNVEKRWRDYLKLRCKEQALIYNSLTKYGVENHTFEIIELCDEDALNDREIYYITLFDTLNKNIGLNLREGGGHGKFSEESKKKMGSWQRGRKFTEEHKAKVRMSKERNNSLRPFLNKHHTQEAKDKISKAHAGKILSEETKLKIRLVNIGKKQSPETIAKRITCGDKNGRYGTGIRICQFDLKGEFIREFMSGTQILKETGFSGSNIIKYCKAGKEIIYGYRWKIKSEEENIIIQNKIKNNKNG